jgi:uncharacterized protein (TIGR02246 family)
MENTMTTIRTLLLIAGLSLAGCTQPPAPPAPPAEPPDTRAADAATIEALVKDWSAAAQAKDAEKFASFYADDAVLLLEGAPDPRGKPAIRDAAVAMMQDPNFALSFATDGVVVSRSGDLAYETGTYTMTTSDAAKKPATQNGHYVVVWQKQADGSWKVARDVPVSDPAEAAK